MCRFGFKFYVFWKKFLKCIDVDLNLMYIEKYIIVCNFFKVGCYNVSILYILIMYLLFYIVFEDFILVYMVCILKVNVK